MTRITVPLVFFCLLASSVDAFRGSSGQKRNIESKEVGHKHRDGHKHRMVVNVKDAAAQHKHTVRHTKNTKKASYTPVRELCPFGYGEGCGGGGVISSATKAQVANVLRGILSNLSSKKGLVEISQSLAKDYNLNEKKNEDVKNKVAMLLTAFQKNKKATTEVVGKLLNVEHSQLSALAAVSKVLIRTQPLQERTGHRFVRTKAQLLEVAEK